MQKTTLFLALAILLFVSACATTTTQPTTTPASEKASTANTNAKVFNVEAFQFSYTPATIEVKKGDTITIKLSTKDVPHSLAIADYNVNVQAYPDAPGEQTFIVDKAGEFSWRCKIPCGSEHTGMKGKLIVRE